MNCPYCEQETSSVRVGYDDCIECCHECEVILETCDLLPSKDDRQRSQRVVAQVAKERKAFRKNPMMQFARSST